MPQRETPENEELIEVRLYGGHPFAMVPKWVTALISTGAISHGAFATFVVLLGYADNSTGQAWPGKKSLCAAVGRTDRVVTGYLRELEAARVLAVQRRPRPGNRNLPNLYHLAVMGPLPPVENLPPVAPEDAPGGVGAEYSPQGEGAADSGEVGAADSGGTRSTKELEEKEMSGGSATPTARADPEPGENPAPAKAGPSVAADFAAWWTAYAAATNAPIGPKATAQTAYATARRNGATAAVLLDGVAAFAAGQTRDARVTGFVPNWPHALTWLRRRRWTEYPLNGPEGAPDGPVAPTADSWTPNADGALYGAAMAARGVAWTRPDVPAGLSAADALEFVRNDYFDWLSRDGGGRWGAAIS